MREYWSIPVKNDPWRTRHHLNTLLFDGITFFHWLCLCTSKNLCWPEDYRAASIYREISIEYWHWQGFHAPDVTVEELAKCDRDLWSWGWLQTIDESVADAMVAEKLRYHPAPLDKNGLIERRIYTEEGWRIWRMIETHLRTPKGPRLRGETVGDKEIYHQGVPFFVSQCCDDCTELLDEKGSISKAEEIGPWCADGVVMPHGWRLICDHPTRRDWTINQHPAVEGSPF